MDVKFALYGFLHDIEWTMFHGHLDYFQKSSLGGQTQNQETMALRTLTTVGLFYFIMSKDLPEQRFIKIPFD